MLGTKLYRPEVNELLNNVSVISITIKFLVILVKKFRYEKIITYTKFMFLNTDLFSS
jgi:hypothetical protein